MNLSFSRRAAALLCAVSALTLACSDRPNEPSRATLSLPAPPGNQQEGGRELHVIGVYEPFGEWQIQVDVARQGRPLVLALNSYRTANWRIRVRQGVNLERVIVGGHGTQRVEGVQCPVECYTYQHAADQPPSAFYFWAHAKFSAETGAPNHHYLDLATKLSRITGLPITSFQGQSRYDGRPFVVDEVRGPVPGAEVHVVSIDRAADHGRSDLTAGRVLEDPAAFFLAVAKQAVRPGPSLAGRIWLALDENQRRLLQKHDLAYLAQLQQAVNKGDGVLRGDPALYLSLPSSFEELLLRSDLSDPSCVDPSLLQEESRQLWARRDSLCHSEVVRLNYLLLRASFPGQIRYAPAVDFRPTEVQLNVDRPGKPIVLVVSAHDAVRWVLRVGPGVQLDRVIACGGAPQEVINTTAPVFFRSRGLTDRWDGDDAYYAINSDYADRKFGKTLRGYISSVAGVKTLTSEQILGDWDGKPITVPPN